MTNVKKEINKKKKQVSWDLGYTGLLLFLLFRIPLTNIIGSEGNGYYFVSFEIFTIFYLIFGYGFHKITYELIRKNKKRYSINSNRIIFTIIMIWAVLSSVLGSALIILGSKWLLTFLDMELSAISLRLLGIWIIISNLETTQTILKEIIKEALTINSIKGSLMYTMIIGMQRAIFSTEVAIGTSAIASAMSETNEESQGYIQILGNYITTFIICTVTALIILTSDFNTYIESTSNGIELAFFAFYYHFQTLGKLFIWLFIFLFAISTVISGFYYGESCLEYLTKNKKIKSVYKGIVIIAILISTYISSSTIWTLVDISVAILCLINLYAIMKIFQK